MRMKEEDLKGAVDIASRYYGSSQQSAPRKRSLMSKAKDLGKSALYKRRIRKKGQEYEDKLKYNAATRSTRRGLKKAGVDKGSYKSY